jgi:putative peptidoglycan lipid II flippase
MTGAGPHRVSTVDVDAGGRRASENREIARAAGLVGFFTLLSRVAGLLRDSVVGYYFGTGVAADAFFVAFRIPNLLRRFVAEGAMSVAFIPVFTDYLTNRSREEAVEAASVLASLMALGLAVLTAVGIVFAPFWTALFAPGFVGEPGKFELTVTLTRMVFPYIFLVSLVALASGILNSLRHFASPAMSPIFLNLSMIAAAFLLCPQLRVPVEGLAYGVLIGGVLQLALQLPPLLRRGMHIVPRWQPGHEAVRRALGLMAPMVFGAAVYQINIMVDTVLASVLPSGSVSYLWYADRVFEFPLGIFAVALGTAALPSFSAQAARGAYDELRRSLTFSIRLTNFIALPAAVGIATLAIPITSVLFRRGAFGFEQAVLTARALSAFAVGLWSVSIVRLIVPAFYALEDTRTPVLTAAAAFVTNCFFSLLLMGPVAATGESGLADAIAAVTRTISVFNLRHAGLALSTSLAATVNLVLLAMLLHRRLGPLGAREIVPSFARSLVASLVMVPPVRTVAGLTDWSQSGHLIAHSVVLLAAVALGVVVFVGVAVILGGTEVQAVTRILRQRFERSAGAQ